MNQHTTFLEYNGVYYEFTKTENEIQWFVVKGHIEFPDLSINYLLSLGRMYMARKTLGVEYNMEPEHDAYINHIVRKLYESQCHACA